MNNNTNPRTPGDNSGSADLNARNDGDGNINFLDPETEENPNESEGNSGEPESPQKSRFKITDFSISGVVKAIRDFWINLPRKSKILALSSAGLVLIAAVIIVVILNQSPYARTYTGLDDKEAGEIIGILESAGIAYKWDPLLKTISIKEKDQATAVGTLSGQGYPRTGVLYEEEVSGNAMFQSTDEKKQQELNNKQRRLEAAIGTISGIQYASVTLVVPDNSKSIIQREVLPSTAGVILQIKPGYSLSTDTIRGIENIVQKSVENLTADNISIIDGNGVVLNGDMNDGVDKYASIGEIREDFERKKEKEIYGKIISLFGSPYGLDGITVACSVESDFSDLITEAKKYTGANVDEDTGVQSGIISSIGKDETISSDTSTDYVGVPGTDPNSDTPGYYENEADLTGERYVDDFHYTDERMVDYVFTQMQRTSPEIVNIGVTVFIDADEIDIDHEEQLYRGIATAAGINRLVLNNLPEDMTTLDIEYLRNYISIIAMPFPRPDDTGGEQEFYFFGLNLFQILIALGAAIIVIIILVIFMIALIGKRRKEKEREVGGEEEFELADVEGLDPSVSSLGLAAGRHAAASRLDEDIEVPAESKEQMLKRQIKVFAEQNPEIAAQLVRTLIKGDEMPSG